MISFRYHLVSIVAVFLALALGVLIGTTRVNQGLVSDLNRRTDAATRRVGVLQQEISQLRSEVRRWSNFADGVEPLLIGDKLAGRKVVMLTLDGVDVSEVDGVRNVLVDSGASVAGVLVVTGKMGSGDEADQGELAGLLRAPSIASGRVLEEAARELGARLATGPDVGGNDLLERLRAARFLELRAVSGGLQDIGGRDQAVVILVEGRGALPVEPELFLSPLIKTLVSEARPVVAAETVNSDAFVAGVRGDDGVDGQVVTVDDVDLMWGRIALVLGLRDLILDPRSGGDYGVKEGASGLVPTP